MKRTYRLASMSPLIAGLTAFVLLLPLLFGVLAISNGPWVLGVTALFLLALYAAVWLWFRPSQFTLTDESLDIQFPLRRRRFPTANFIDVRAMDSKAFRAEVGWAVRVGVGGLWGGFGWLLTQQRGLVEFYISRMDGFVYIDLRDGSPLLLTPANPQQFVETLKQIVRTPNR